MSSTSEALKKYWQLQGIALNAGVSETDLASFERKYKISLPQDFRDYLLTVNGFDSEHWTTDENVIAFLSLNEMQPLSEWWSAEIADSDSYFVFADHSMSVHVYAIHLSSGLADRNLVVVVYDNEPVNVASSFSEFVEGYLANDDAVLFPQPGSVE
jgi:hypothetical protein